jgi:hypothetical protein
MQGCNSFQRRIRHPRDVHDMKVALLILCMGAVTFLLRVLVALVKEDQRWPRTMDTVHCVKFRPSRQREEPIRMDSELQAGKGMAL